LRQPGPCSPGRNLIVVNKPPKDPTLKDIMGTFFNGGSQSQLSEVNMVENKTTIFLDDDGFKLLKDNKMINIRPNEISSLIHEQNQDTFKLNDDTLKSSWSSFSNL